MQTAIIRIYDDPLCHHVTIEGRIRRAKAMEEILTGFRAARDGELHRDLRHKLGRGFYVQWAGYQPYRTAAPLGEQHLTHIRLSPGIGGRRYEYAFPGGLSTVECDDLCVYAIGPDGTSDQQREWLVTSTLAGMLHCDGISLANYVIGVACGRTALVGGIEITPATPPTTLYAAVCDRGWPATVEWLRDTQTMLDKTFDDIWADRAVWVPVDAPRLPWEPLLLRHDHDKGCRRLAMGSEAAAYAGHRIELAVSAAERADWLFDKDAELMTGMSQGKWRRWIETHREVRIGRPIGRDGHLAMNRRLIHQGDLRHALRLSCAKDDGDICKGVDCPQRCWKTKTCPHHDRDCPAS